jgi:hypothetical protein
MSIPSAIKRKVPKTLQDTTAILSRIAKYCRLHNNTQKHVDVNTLRKAFDKLCDEMQDAMEADDIARVDILLSDVEKIGRDAWQLMAKA